MHATLKRTIIKRGKNNSAIIKVIHEYGKMIFLAFRIVIAGKYVIVVSRLRLGDRVLTNENVIYLDRDNC